MHSSMVEILCFPEGSFKVVMKKKMAFTQKKTWQNLFWWKERQEQLLCITNVKHEVLLLPRIQGGKHIMQEVNTMKTNGKVEWEDGEDKENAYQERFTCLAGFFTRSKQQRCLSPREFPDFTANNLTDMAWFCSGEDDKSPVVSSFQVWWEKTKSIMMNITSQQLLLHLLLKWITLLTDCS